MHNLIFGFELMVIGLAVVFVSLLLLALILAGFSKLFYKPESAQKGKDIDYKTKQTGGSGGETRSRATLETTGESKQLTVRSEIIAASMGALLYALDRKQNALLTGNMPGPATNIWAQTGRARALSIRQDFALLRKGKRR
jgi:Na+-transporting methylmalonyl-CoA/oxaloacetate decarboxylase gamma subunit